MLHDKSKKHRYSKICYHTLRKSSGIVQAVTKKQSNKKRIMFRLTVLVYLGFLLLTNAVTPTTAYFTETVTTKGTIIVSENFPEKEQMEDKTKDEKNGESEIEDDSSESKMSHVDSQSSQGIPKEDDTDEDT